MFLIGRPSKLLLLLRKGLHIIGLFLGRGIFIFVPFILLIFLKKMGVYPIYSLILRLISHFEKGGLRAVSADLGVLYG